MSNDNPFAPTEAFSAMVQAVVLAAEQRPPVQLSPRERALKQFLTLNDEQRQAALKHLRAARKGTTE